MLVSAFADDRLRQDVADGRRPRPEYLVLESTHDVDLLDWSMLSGGVRARGAWQSAVHVAAALRRVHAYDVVFSDGEHIGIPLALAMRSLGIRTPHLVIGHHLSTAPKSRLLRNLHAHRGMTRILVHSGRQHAFAERKLGVPGHKLEFVPYYADSNFWQPLDVSEERLVVTAGLEHRDYLSLATACADMDVRVFVASGSVHSPAAGARLPVTWPGNFERGFADYTGLRDLYARASVVVVPVLNTDFQAGVTTVLEAMAMGKAVITTNAAAQGGVIRDGITGIAVPPEDSAELGAAVRFLLSSPADRARLGRAAREAVVSVYDVETYASRLATHLADLRDNRAAA
jgi:glycosyltransferase involved in cell wall biosynthesis